MNKESADSSTDPKTDIDSPDTRVDTGKTCTYGDPTVVGKLDDTRITEVSGLSYSETQDVLWVHNDSGEQTALFYALSLQGSTVGTFSLNGVNPIDWEDMSNGTVNGTPVLFFADMGDNAARDGQQGRANIIVYRVNEPDIPEQNPLTPVGINDFETYTFTYPDGARDCEALFFDSETGSLYFLSKVNNGASSLFVAPQLVDGSTVELTKIGEVTFGTPDIPGTPLTTAGALSDDNRQILVRTYTSLVLFPWASGTTFESAFEQVPQALTPPIEIQGEAADFSPNGSVYTISEGNLPDIHLLERVCE